MKLVTAFLSTIAARVRTADDLVVIPGSVAEELCAELRTLTAEREAPKAPDDIAAGAKAEATPDAAKADLERQVYLATEAARFFSRSFSSVLMSAARIGIAFETGAEHRQGVEHHTHVIGHLTEASSTMAEAIEGTAKGYDAMKAQLAALADMTELAEGYVTHPRVKNWIASTIVDARALLNG